MKNSLKTISLSLLVMALWGSLFPMVKIGYSAFNINSASIPDIIMFAGVRFVICGLVVCAYSYLRKERIAAPKGKNILYIFIMGLFSIVLHYAFTYIGLSSTDSSKTALIKQLGVLIYVCFAFLFFKNEKFSALKIVGAVIGFCGIIAINYNPDGIRFSVGDILIIAASVCTVISSIISKKSVEGNSPFWITGISQLTGGIILLVAAFVMGAEMLTFDFKSILVFAYICTASICAYTLWYYVLKNNSLSKMFIIKFAEPLFACIFGAVFLGENIFKIQYLLAFVLISTGIILGNRSEVRS
ncbi:MAG: EamA family transporter [Acutalibacteraceae bacterium]|nr:EamA family transporter [Acutalibacteraceae bacterium]